MICTGVSQLANANSFRERRPNGGIAASLVVFFVKGHNVAQSVVNNGIKAAGVWYQVKTYPNAGPDSKWELCSGWGLIENTCANKPKCGYISGHHQTSDHKCNVVGSSSNQGSLCSHTVEKCPNGNENHIAFSSRCMKMTEDVEAARKSSNIGLAGRESTSAALDRAIATGSNRVVLGPRPQDVAEGG